MPREKLDIITFKVPESLRDAMKGISNRSEFIRNAVVAALESTCPLCKGTGIIMPNQRAHWNLFANSHHFEECDTCNAIHVVCEKGPKESVHAHEAD